MTVEQLLGELRNSTQLKIVVGLILLDLGLGLMAALKTRKWEWKMVANFYVTNVIPYVGGYVLLRSVVTWIWDGVEVAGLPAPELLVTTAWATLLMTLVNSLVKNLVELYPPLGSVIQKLTTAATSIGQSNSPPPQTPPQPQP